MKIQRRHKVSAAFQMSSLTDIIFLLLIFFMLTSTFVAPNAIKLSLPSATSGVIANQTVEVSVTKDLKYYVKGKQVSYANLESELSIAIFGLREPIPTVVLRVDKAVPTEHLVNVLKIGNKLSIRMILATKPE